MELPDSPKRCLAIVMLRLVGLSQKEAARIARCANQTVVDVEKWFREEDYHRVARICDDQSIKKMVAAEAIYWGLEEETLVKLDRLTQDDILRHYRTDYMKAEEPDIESVVTQLKARLFVPAPEDVLIDDFGGPGRHRIYAKKDTIKVIQENLGYGVSMVKATRESSSAGSSEINLEVSTYGDLKLHCLVKGKDYSLSKKLISSLSETAQQKFDIWKKRGGQYLGICSEIYREIHIEASYKTGQSIYEFGSRVFSKLGPPPLTPLFGDLVYQLCILYRRSRGQYGLPDRRLYKIKRRGLIFSALYLGKLHLANAPLSPPPPPPLPPLPSFLPPLPRPPPPPNFLETWIDFHRNMIVNRSASPAIAELLELFQDLRVIEAAIKKELDGLIPGKQP